MNTFRESVYRFVTRSCLRGGDACLLNKWIAAVICYIGAWTSLTRGTCMHIWHNCLASKKYQSYGILGMPAVLIYVASQSTCRICIRGGPRCHARFESLVELRCIIIYMYIDII